MNELSILRKVLTDKLIEWAKDEYQAEIMIDLFLSTMDALTYDEDDRLKVLEDAKDCFSDGFIKDRLIYEATAIKVNYGY